MAGTKRIQNIAILFSVSASLFAVRNRNNVLIYDNETARHHVWLHRLLSQYKDRINVFDDRMPGMTGKVKENIADTGRVDQHNTHIRSSSTEEETLLTIELKKFVEMPTSASRILSPASSSRSPTSFQFKIPRSPTPSKTTSTSAPVGLGIRASGLLTPPSSNSSSANVSNSDTTLEIAVDTSAKSVTQSPPQIGHPRYVAAHMGEPCTIGSLDHLLKCGHKVMTSKPDMCAKNCHKVRSEYANPRSVDEPFVCMACVTEELRNEHAEKVRSFRDELKSVAKQMKKTNPDEWISQKLQIMHIAWRDLEIEKLEAKAVEGRSCHAIYVDEDYQSLIGGLNVNRIRSSWRTQKHTVGQKYQENAANRLQEAVTSHQQYKLPAKSPNSSGASSLSPASISPRPSKLPKPRSR